MSAKTSRRKGSILLSLLLILSLLLTPVVDFQSEAARATGTVKNRILNVRSSASTGSSIVCKLSQGAKVTIISETTGDDGLKWYNVYFAYNSDTKEGFVRADLVTVSGSVSSSGTSQTSSSTASAGSVKYVKPSVAIVRTYASTDGDIRARLAKGTSVTVITSKTGTDSKTWYKVSFSLNGTDMNGYIRGDLLTDTGSASTAASSSGTAGSTVSGTQYVSVDVARVRTYASTNGDIRSRLVKGTAVTLLSSKTGDDGKTWYKVSYKDGGTQLNGYIRSDMLTEQAASTTSASTAGTSTSTSTAASIKPTVANIRTYASTNGDIRSKLSQGTAVTILSEKTGDDGKKWYKISYTYNGSSMTGYIRSDLLNTGSSSSSSSSGTSSGSSTGSGSGTSSGGVAQVRTYASPYADIRTTLQNGTKVTILKEVTGDDGEKWTKISFTQDGAQMQGYVLSSLLK